MMYVTDNDTLDKLQAHYQELLACGKERILSAEEADELFHTFCNLVQRFKRVARISDKYQAQMKDMLDRLHENLSGAVFMRGTLHICAACKKLQNADGEWVQFEQYITERSDTFFSHGLCPSCAANVEGEVTSDETREHAPLNITEADLEDMVIVRYMHFFTTNLFEHSQLYQEFRDLFARYLQQSRRLKRIAHISDSYQSELRALSDQMTRASRTDALTGMNNRSYFLELLDNEIKRCDRHDHTISFMLLDFDHFKQINDTYGHLAGDAVLKAFAMMLPQCDLRQHDFWGRLGGEEFGVALPETPQQQSLNPAERICANMADSPVTYQGQSITLTVSIGISQLMPGDTVETLIQRADQALYNAKRSGRNRVCLG